MVSKLIKCKTCGKEIAANAKMCPNCGSKDKKPIYKKWWFYLLILVLVIVILVSTGDDSSTTPVTSDNSSTNSTEVIGSSVVKKYTTIAENVEMDMTISDDAIKFMSEHENFFPGNESIRGTISDSVNFDVTYAHLSKNISKYDDKLICVSGYVLDIQETEDGSLTYIHIVDYEDNNYTFYYLGALDEIFEESIVTVYALPFSMVTFENLNAEYTQAVAGAACLVF